MMRMPTMPAPGAAPTNPGSVIGVLRTLQAEFLGRAASFAFYSLHVSR
jgi:hypothetical protein